MIGGGRSASHQSNSMRKSSNKPATGNVTWRGFTARYTPAEREFMRRLKRWPEEAAFAHEAKSRFNGRLK